NADARLQWSTGLQSANRLDQLQPRPYRPFSVILVGLQIAKYTSTPSPMYFATKPPKRLGQPAYDPRSLPLRGRMERVLADINADDGDSAENLGHGVLLVCVPLAADDWPDRSTVGPSH